MNTTLKQAFEQAEKKTIDAMPDEDRIIRPYSQKFTDNMDALLSSKENGTAPVRVKRKIKWPALIAAVLIIAIFCAGAVSGEELSKIFSEKIKEEQDKDSGLEFGVTYDVHNDEDDGQDVYEPIGEGGIEELDYTGEDLKMTFFADTGLDATGCDYDIMVFIDGIQQTFTAEHKGIKVEDVTRFTMTIKSGESEKVDISFKPNIGKSGEKKEMYVVMQFDTGLNYAVQCDTPYKEIMPTHDFESTGKICSKCGMDKMSLYGGLEAPPFSISTMAHATINMKEDAPAQTEVAESFSGLEINPIHELILKTYEYEEVDGSIHSEYDESVAVVNMDLYKDIEEHFYFDNDVLYTTNKIYTTASPEDEFTLTFHGKPGKYRVSLYNGTELLTAFDGKSYIDIDINYGSQTDLNVKLDTTKFEKGSNFVYAFYQDLDENAENDGIRGELIVTTVIVE